jgi:hypothetical protein
MDAISHGTPTKIHVTLDLLLEKWLEDYYLERGQTNVRFEFCSGTGGERPDHVHVRRGPITRGEVNYENVPVVRVKAFNMSDYMGFAEEEEDRTSPLSDLDRELNMSDPKFFEQLKVFLDRMLG